MAKTKATAKKPVKNQNVDIAGSVAKMRNLLDEMVPDVTKFVDQEVKASARRLRGHAQEIRKLCGQFRKDIMTVVNARRG